MVEAVLAPIKIQFHAATVDTDRDDEKVVGLEFYNKDVALGIVDLNRQGGVVSWNPDSDRSFGAHGFSPRIVWVMKEPVGYFQLSSKLSAS